MAKTMVQSPPCGSNTGGGGDGGGDGGAKAGTTFVQADSTCFRDLVQRLTSPSGTQAQAQSLVKSPAPKPTQKLHERRKYTKPKIEIGKPTGFQVQQPMQPSIVFAGSQGADFGAWCPTSPSSSVVMLSPLSSLQVSPSTTPVPIGSSNKRVSPSETLELNPGEEEKAIKEKRFYLHPSPRSKPRLAPEPELLTLFPLESPTTSSGTN